MSPASLSFDTILNQHFLGTTSDGKSQPRTLLHTILTSIRMLSLGVTYPVMLLGNHLPLRDYPQF